MFELFHNVTFDWIGKRKIFIGVSILIMLAGLASAIGRQLAPGGTDAFNLGIDFKGGTVVTAKFKQRPPSDEIRTALNQIGVRESVIQDSTNNNDEVLIKIPLIETAETAQPPAEAQKNQTPEAQKSQQESNDIAEAREKRQVRFGL